MPSFSHSKLATFDQCPLKYKFRYVDEIPPPIRSIELHLGDSVHRALEALYSEAQQDRTQSSNDFLALFRQKWDEEYTPDMRIVRKGTTAQMYFDSGRQMLAAYYRRFHPFRQTATLELEEKFLFPISEEHEIRGIIDRLARNKNGTLEIHDYKTSRRLPDDFQVQSDVQLALYEIAIRHRWPDAKEITLIWHYLAFDKDIRITKSPQQLETVKRNTLGRIRRIEGTKTFQAHVSALCDWCEYKEMCPAIKKR